MYANLKTENGQTIKSLPEFNDVQSNIMYWYYQQRILNGDTKLTADEAKQALTLRFNLDLTPEGYQCNNVHFKGVENTWNVHLKNASRYAIEVKNADGVIIPTPKIFYLQGVVDEYGYIPF